MTDFEVVEEPEPEPCNDGTQPPCDNGNAGNTDNTGNTGNTGNTDNTNATDNTDNSGNTGNTDLLFILLSFHSPGLLATSQSPQQFVDHRIVLVIPDLTTELSFSPPTVRHHFDSL